MNSGLTKCALITGASSGFGLLTTVTLARRGWRVIASMRDVSRGGRLEEAARKAGVWERIELRRLDVTRGEQIEELASGLMESGARLDALINNAGFAVAGFADDVSDAELRMQLETNFFGAAAVTRALLPIFRRQGFGHVVMVSSVSGRSAFPGVGSYAASKFALEGWTETLRLEMRPLGIQVVLVEPGSFQTDIWTRGAYVSERSRGEESANAERLMRWQELVRSRKSFPDAQRVADGIARIVETRRPRLRYVFGTDARVLLTLRAILPWRLFEALLIRASKIM